MFTIQLFYPDGTEATREAKTERQARRIANSSSANFAIITDPFGQVIEAPEVEPA